MKVVLFWLFHWWRGIFEPPKKLFSPLLRLIGMNQLVVLLTLPVAILPSVSLAATFPSEFKHTCPSEPYLERPKTGNIAFKAAITPIPNTCHTVDTFEDVTAYINEKSDGSSNSSYYQCAEFVQRYLAKKFGTPYDDRFDETLGTQGFMGLNFHPNYGKVPTSSSLVFTKKDTPATGDVIVFYRPETKDTTPVKHVAIVKAVDNNVATLIEQNWVWNKSYSINRKLQKIGEEWCETANGTECKLTGVKKITVTFFTPDMTQSGTGSTANTGSSTTPTDPTQSGTGDTANTGSQIPQKTIDINKNRDIENFDTFPTGSGAQTANNTISTGKTETSSCDTTCDGSPPFPDVEIGNLACPAIQCLRKKGIIEGYKKTDDTCIAGNFCPKNDINRAEFTKIVIKAGVEVEKVTLSDDCNSIESPFFKDVKNDPGLWYCLYVKTAKKNGIVGGYDDGTFKPDKLINRAEAIKIIRQSILTPEVKPEYVVTSDNPCKDWWAQYLSCITDSSQADTQKEDKRKKMLTSNSAMKTCSDEVFGTPPKGYLVEADKELQRGEMARLIHCVMDKAGLIK